MGFCWTIYCNPATTEHTSCARLVDVVSMCYDRMVCRREAQLGTPSADLAFTSLVHGSTSRDTPPPSPRTSAVIRPSSRTVTATPIVTLLALSSRAQPAASPSSQWLRFTHTVHHFPPQSGEVSVMRSKNWPPQRLWGVGAEEAPKSLRFYCTPALQAGPTIASGKLLPSAGSAGATTDALGGRSRQMGCDF